MSHRHLLAAVLFLAVLFVGIRLWNGMADVARIQPLELPVPVETDSSTSRVELSPLAPREADARAGAPRLPPVEKPPAPAPTSASRILGRVVDERGGALAGVKVTPTGKGIVAVETDAVGRFEVTASLPEDARFALVFQSNPHHSRSVLNLARVPKPTERLLPPGDTDLGDVILLDRGAVRGRVLDERRAPIAGARVAIVSPMPETVPGTATESDGTFVLGSLPAGKHALSVSAERYLPQGKLAFEAALRSTHDVGDIVLSAAPILSGVVVDDLGAPARGVVLVAYPVKGPYPTAHATSDESGAFTIHLTARATFGIETRADENYEANGSERSPDAPSYEPGTRGIRITATRARTYTFRVVDAGTRAPVTTFAFHMERQPNAWERKDRGEPFEEHAQGEVRSVATRGVSRVVVSASGYAVADVLVEPDPGSIDVVTIPLTPGARIFGRVVRQDVAFPNADVVLRTETFGGDGRPTAEPGANPKLNANDTKRARPWQRRVRSDAEGFFDFTRVPPGSYALSFGTGFGPEVHLRDQRVAAGEALDVGDVEVPIGATVRGRLLAPTGESPVNFHVRAARTYGAAKEARSQFFSRRVASHEGTFEFTGLAPGDWTFTWARPELDEKAAVQAMQGATIVAGLSEGEVRTVQLDATRSGACRLDVRVVRDGAPVVGAVVTLHVASASAGMPPPGTSKSMSKGIVDRYVGRTDESGRLSTTIEGEARFRVSAALEKGAPLATSEELVATASGRIECELAVRLGSLVLELPASLTPPLDGSVRVSLKKGGQDLHRVVFVTPTSRFQREGQPTWNSGLLRLGDYEAGEYEADVQFVAWSYDESGASPKTDEPLYPAHRTKVTVREGAETRLVVP